LHRFFDVENVGDMLTAKQEIVGSQLAKRFGFSRVAHCKRKRKEFRY